MVVATAAISFANALADTVAGEGVDSGSAADALTELAVTGPQSRGVLVLLQLALAVMLLVLLISNVVRVTITILLVVGAPLALMCHGLPGVEGAARWWVAILYRLPGDSQPASTFCLRYRPERPGEPGWVGTRDNAAAPPPLGAQRGRHPAALRGGGTSVAGNPANLTAPALTPRFERETTGTSGKRRDEPPPCFRSSQAISGSGGSHEASRTPAWGSGVRVPLARQKH